MAKTFFYVLLGVVVIAAFISLSAVLISESSWSWSSLAIFFLRLFCFLVFVLMYQGILSVSWMLRMIHCRVSGFCYVSLKKIGLDLRLPLTWLNSNCKFCLPSVVSGSSNSSAILLALAGCSVSAPFLCSLRVNWRFRLSLPFLGFLSPHSPVTVEP